jgi:hypothetical protein
MVTACVPLSERRSSTILCLYRNIELGEHLVRDQQLATDQKRSGDAIRWRSPPESCSGKRPSRQHALVESVAR